MPEGSKAELRKLKDLEVEKLKGKLLEVRRIGAEPIFIAVEKKDSIGKALEKADIPIDEDEIKVEALKPSSTTWEAVKLSAKAFDYDKIAVTTKIAGAY